MSIIDWLEAARRCLLVPLAPTCFFISMVFVAEWLGAFRGD